MVSKFTTIIVITTILLSAKKVLLGGEKFLNLKEEYILILFSWNLLLVKYLKTLIFYSYFFPCLKYLFKDKENYPWVGKTKSKIVTKGEKLNT